MGIERKDVRFKLDDDIHAGLTIIADAEGIDIGEWVEQVIAPKVRQRIHAATVIADKASRLGISGNAPQQALAVPGRNRE